MGRGSLGRRSAAALAVIAVAAAVTAVASTGGEEDSSREMRTPLAAQDAATGAGSGPGDVAVKATAGDESASLLPSNLGQAKVVKTASIDVEVRRGAFDAAFSKVSMIAANHGGFIASSTSSRASDSEERQAAGSLVVRVPAAAFDDVRSAVVALGEVRGLELRGDDVGGQLADLDARLRNLRSQEEAIRLLMTRTTNVGETLEVQRQLGQVREQIERLVGEQARLSDAVAFATITVSLAEPGAALVSTEDGTSIAGAFARALDGAAAVVAAVIVSLGYLLPLCVLLGIAWLVARPVIRLRRAGS